jgi:hypothetical protein
MRRRDEKGYSDVQCEVTVELVTRCITPMPTSALPSGAMPGDLERLSFSAVGPGTARRRWRPGRWAGYGRSYRRSASWREREQVRVSAWVTGCGRRDPPHLRQDVAPTWLARRAGD